MEFASDPPRGQNKVNNSMSILSLNRPGIMRSISRSRLGLLTGLAAALIWASQPVSAASFTVGLDRDTVTLGENATLSLNFVGGTPQSVPTPPEIPGLQIDYVGRSSQFSDINGQVSSTVSHNFSV